MAEESPERREKSDSPEQKKSSRVTRRQLLAAGSVVAVGGLAGCGGSSGGRENNSTSTQSTPTPISGTVEASNGTSLASSSNDQSSDEATDQSTSTAEPAAFSNMNLTGPENATVDESFSLNLSVQNSGGQSGTYNGTIAVSEGGEGLNRTVEIADIPPGQTGNATVGPINVSAADNYTMSVRDGDTSHSLSIGPVTLSIGDSYTFENELKATVNAVGFHPTLLYSASSGGTNGESQTRLLQPGSKKMLMVVRLSLENVGTSEAKFTTQQPNGASGSDAALLLVRPGNWYESLDNAPLSALNGVKGQPLNRATLSAGQQQSGWLLAQVPRFAAADIISLNHQRDATNTRPEATWKLAPSQGSKRALPKFSLQNFQMPSPRPITSGAKYTIAVTNTGNAPGTFRGLITVSGSGSTNQQTVKAISKRISPGVTKTIQGTHPRQFVNSKTYQLEPFGRVATMKTTLAERRFGQSYPTPFQQELTVGQPVTSDQIVYKGNHEFAPDRGKQFVSIPVTVNLTGQEASIPSYRYYSLKSGGSTYESELVTPQYNIQQQPVSGRKYRRLDMNSGGQGTGVLVFQVPRRVSTNQLSIQMKYDEGNSQPYGAVWANSTSASTMAGTRMPSTTTDVG